MPKSCKKIAILTAAGIGTRMKQDIPKQFLTIKNKPVIVYTMEAFENHPNIDAIIVVCLAGWDNILESYARQFHISKLAAIVSGGKCGQESIKNGLAKAQDLFNDKDIVLIHDGNRAFISPDIISDSIATCQLRGNAVAAIPCAEVIVLSNNDLSAQTLIDRNKAKRTQTPHAFFIKDLADSILEAEKRGIKNSPAMCSLYLELGKEIHLSTGSEKNLKLTTVDDIDIFESLLEAKHDDCIRR